MSTLKWWGYLHTNGSVQLKRFFSFQDLEEAGESPFVQRYTQPFDATDRDDADTKARALLGVN